MAEAVLESTVKAATEAIGRPDCDLIKKAIEEELTTTNLNVTFKDGTVHVTCSVHSFSTRVSIQNIVATFLTDGTSQSNDIIVQ